MAGPSLSFGDIMRLIIVWLGIGIMLFSAAASACSCSSQDYAIPVGMSQTFVVAGESIALHEATGVASITSVRELASGVWLVDVTCTSSETGTCTGTITGG